MNISAAGKTHTGQLRQNNEDCIFWTLEPEGVFPNVFAAADGMGGHMAGEVASGKAVEFFRRWADRQARNPEPQYGPDDTLDALTAAVSYANRQIYLASCEDSSLKGMGTTFTACVIRQGRAYAAHVGDSRMYCLSGGVLRQITNDHTYVNELIRAGSLKPEAARFHPQRNMLTRALGVDPSVQVDGYIAELSPGDRLLLCSDGLTAMLEDEEIRTLMALPDAPEQRAERFIDEANARGGVDNISVVLIDTAE